VCDDGVDGARVPQSSRSPLSGLRDHQPLLTAPAHAGAPTEQLRGDIARVFQTLDAQIAALETYDGATVA